MFGSKKLMGKVFVGLSGGVDSAVSAALLKKDGWDVVGVFIRIAIEGYPCTAGEDKIEAQRVAAHLNIPFIEIDLSKEYEREVFKNTIDEFKKGRTPNPDTLCNRQIKFGHFWEFAKSRGADFIATGHYARKDLQIFHRRSWGPVHLSGEEKFAGLFTGADESKDQSYFLWMVPQEVLRHTLFPVGHLHKDEVRSLAKKFNLPNAARKDSQGLCFLGPISIEEMLMRELAPRPGQVLNEAGEVVGEHQGVALYTLGQRHGFTRSLQGAHEQPHFVIAKDIAGNTITVSTFKTPQGKSKTEVTLVDTNWVGQTPAGSLSARYRYRGALIFAELSIKKNVVTLQEPQYIPEGQSLVLYQGERCLGGGIVDSAQLL